MPSFIITELYVFLYSLLGGMLIAFIYDIFRIKRRIVKTSVVFLHLEDILFWIIAVIVMFLFVHYTNEGEIRGYIFIGAFAGAAVYMLLLSKIIISCSVAILNFTIKAVKLILFILTYPVRLVFKILSFPAKFLLKGTKKLCGHTVRLAKTATRSGISRITKLKNLF
ncbi:MAG: spore cortex biosynthesis protein YabQ, partial [Clostridiaceae bacterium]|nr:spore cortex biosynthesis protein YabQ [Clostridiaceae bacterium]